MLLHFRRNPVLIGSIRNIKPIKDAASNTSSKRIDCVITSLMAHGRIKALLEEGIDTRTAEEIQADMEKLLESIPY